MPKSSVTFPTRCASMVLFLFLILTLSACARLTQDTLAKVHNGMSAAEVKALIGAPTEETTNTAFSLTTTTYSYHASNGDVKIIFVNDKVWYIDGHLQ